MSGLEKQNYYLASWHMFFSNQTMSLVVNGSEHYFLEKLFPPPLFKNHIFGRS